MKKNKAIDQYIVSREEFARPILDHLRALIHSAVDVEETLKWSMPHFMYNGKILISIAAFKQHCALVIPVLSQIETDIKIDRSAMGQFGRITTLKDLPSDARLKKIIKEAAKAIDAGKKPMGERKRTKAEPLEVPSDLNRSINKNVPAKKFFSTLSNGHRNEFIRWINEAKREETRVRRIEKAVAMLATEKKSF